MELYPSEIRYAQDSISNKFTDGTSLTSTFAYLLSGELSVESLPAMECVKKKGRWYAVSGNRRLFLYKHLEEAGVLDTVIVSRARGYRRFTTKCNGLDVRCRGHGLEADIQEIVAEWERGEDVVARWGDSVAMGNFSTYRDGPSHYDDDDYSDDDDDCGWNGEDESCGSDYDYHCAYYDDYWY